jgi:hypothetical protein
MSIVNRKRWAALVAFTLGTTMALTAATSAMASGQDPGAPQSSSDLASYLRGAGDSGHRGDTPRHLEKQLLAKAAPDECFAGIGKPYPAGTYDSEGRLTCPEGSQPKVNQAYVWGLTKAGDDLWFGTGPNIHCLVLSSYLQTTTSVQTPSYVCEGEDSTYRTTWTPGATLPPQLGDFRPPDLFVYDQATKTLTKKNDALDATGKARLHSTLGIRSAGSIGNRVFFAGPAISPTGGLNVFVFDTDGSFVGSETLPGFSNIRKWVEVNGQLYTGVRQGNGGAVLHYTGSTPDDPFQYEIVGTMTSEPAELADYDGRLFVSTWPAQEMASLWMSPLYGSDGALSPADSGGWQRVWQASDYDPDPVTAGTYGGGALVAFGGKLYWGTMHVPFTAALAHAARYGESTGTQALLANILGSNRAISIFRGDNFGTAQQHVDLLYGESKLPVYDGTSWTLQPNNMGTDPLYGHSGFGNVFNNYTWTMAVFHGSLYVGTMDWSYLIAEGLSGPLAEQLGLPAGTQLPFPTSTFGADLWRFTSPDRPAVPESINGVGNYSSYGIRTMVSDDALYLGMANPMNLLTDTTDDKPEGGWELIRMSDPGSSDGHAPWIIHARVHPSRFDISRDHKVKFSMKISKDAYTSFTVKRHGDVVRRFHGTFSDKGWVSQYWHGRNDHGHLVHRGKYVVVMKAAVPHGPSRTTSVTFHVTR